MTTKTVSMVVFFLAGSVALVLVAHEVRQAILIAVAGSAKLGSTGAVPGIVGLVTRECALAVIISIARIAELSLCTGQGQQREEGDERCTVRMPHSEIEPSLGPGPK